MAALLLDCNVIKDLEVLVGSTTGGDGESTGAGTTGVGVGRGPTGVELALVVLGAVKLSARGNAMGGSKIPRISGLQAAHMGSKALTFG